MNISIYLITSVFSGFTIGNNFFFISHTSAGRAAGERIMKLINEKTEEQIQSKYSNNILSNSTNAKGRIELKNVSFRYKGDGKLVLNNISLVI